MKTIPELIEYVGERRPMEDPEAIRRNVPKLKKIAKTLAKRDNEPADTDTFRGNTWKYYKRARQLAEEIGCGFAEVNGRRYLTVGVQRERLT